MDGGLGDHIAALVAIDYIIKTYTWITPLIWVQDFFKDFAIHILPKGSNVFSFSEMKGKYQPSRPTKTTQWDGIVSPMKIHGVDYGFLKLCDENPSIEHKNSLQLDTSTIQGIDLSTTKYVVITTGYTAPVREFLPEHINTISKYLVNKGITPVFLGQSSTKTGTSFIIRGEFNTQVDYALGIDLRNKTTLLQAAKVMEGAIAVVGVDNGLLHVAGCTQVHIVGGFTTVSPKLRMPIRHNTLGWNYSPVIPDKTLECSFCQVKTNFLYGHDYKKCMYNDYLCTKQLTAEKFIHELKKVYYD